MVSIAGNLECDKNGDDELFFLVFCLFGFVWLISDVFDLGFGSLKFFCISLNFFTLQKFTSLLFFALLAVEIFVSRNQVFVFCWCKNLTSQFSVFMGWVWQ